MFRIIVVSAAIAIFLMMFCNENPVEQQPTGPEVSFVTTKTVANETDTVDEYSSTEVMLIASLSSPADSEITVSFTITGDADSGEDFTVSRNRFLFMKGITLCTTMVFLSGDDMVEPPETVIFTLVAPKNVRLGEDATSTLVIEDKPVVNMEFDKKTVSRRSGTFTVSALLTQRASVEVKVPFSVSGSAEYPAAHDLSDGVFIFPAGDTVATKVVNVINDSSTNEFRDMEIALGVPTGAKRGWNSTGKVTIAYDPVVSYQLLDNEYDEWTQSPYASGFRVVTGYDFFDVINGGAQVFYQNNYIIALVQNMIKAGGKELNFIVIEFDTLKNIDSVFNAKTKDPNSFPPVDVTIPGFDTTTALGYFGLDAITTFARFGTTYFEVVIKGFSEEQQLLDKMQQALTTLKEHMP